MLVRAFINSTILTVVSVAIMVVLAAMVGYVLQRKREPRWNPVVNFFVLAGLIVPPAVVPTIWVLQGLGLFKTHARHDPDRGRPSGSRSASCCSAPSSPRSPASSTRRPIIDGAGPIRLFFRVVLPLLRPVIVTVIVVQSVAVFNDFTEPAVLPAGQRERHGAADAVQLPEPVPSASTTCCSWTSC